MRKLIIAAIALGLPATVYAAQAGCCSKLALCCLLHLGCCH